eukprot:CAMPEP_0174330002 /NCGR_PEP_ID=MMETSP0810-20121108/16323_1 /TAXON_ID=73025 ORGANISM="Eutreptiella gymnastica-like, Strain CCMP1594" /NCGR_SAMPLE_ID=MMETSP0810 /ASSEMBLY_ACC=CAM_ASM_000659 /LENGTH=155 /DNA_ID=CAMNT_0015444897 /DNA_START=2597 /DNA_END=3062 /DNA_ORIENTATION=-
MSAGHGYWGRLPLPFLLDVPMALVCAPYEVTPERETVQPSTCSVNEHHFTFFWLEASVPHVWRQVYRMAQAMVAHLRDLHTYLHDCGEMARRRGSAGDCAAPEVSCLYSPPRPKSGIQPRQRSSRLSEGPPLKNLQAPMTAGALGQSEDMPQTGW